MFGIGAPEFILILVGALIIFGPQRLPEIAAQAGKAIRDFRRMSDDLTGELRRSIEFDPQAEQPVLTSETIAASETPQTISETISESLRVETIPSDDEDAAENATTATAAPEAEDTVISVAPMATKAEPLNGVSMLDQPQPYIAADALLDHPAIVAPDSAASTAAAEPTEYVYEPSTPAATDYSYTASTVDTAPVPAAAVDPVADAWDAVMTTEATAAPVEAAPAVDTPIVESGAYAAQQLPYVPPPRIRVDPTAEVTIREKIEAQTAAEAFRERRRLAHYQRRNRQG